MSQFSSDLRILIFIFGIYWGIRTVIKEYGINKMKTNKKCFPLFVSAVFFFEVVIVICLITLCTNWFFAVRNIMSYAIFSWALCSFCYSGYMFSGVATNDNESKMEKFKGKVAIWCGIYFVLVTIVSYET